MLTQSYDLLTVNKYKQLERHKTLAIIVSVLVVDIFRSRTYSENAGMVEIGRHRLYRDAKMLAQRTTFLDKLHGKSHLGINYYTTVNTIQ